jgi:threonylcarbamoyladenosine tRNA methylthiotransferase MtaB
LSSFHIHNFGCRASQADGSALATQLTGKGFEQVRCAADASLVILNTCTVTAAADDELRQIVRRVHRENPQARIVVTGCYAQRAPQELAELPGVAMVVGNSHKTELPDLLAPQSAAPFHGQIFVEDIFARHDFHAAPALEAGQDKSRPNLKIQDGCNNRCSFCIIPFVRGRSRSSPANAIISQIRELSRTYSEVVLTGVNLGRWGREPFSNVRLAGLLRRILDETDIELVRLSSVEPMDWSDDLLELVASSPRIANHVHAPLQSGSDTVLRRMHRKYRPRHYEDRIRRARTLMPDAAIGADVMVGFPGETDAEFEDTRAFIDALPFTYLHVFTYSERPGTPAAAHGDQIPVPVRKQRNRILRELGARKNLAFRQAMVGRTLTAVALTDPGEALTSNYLRLELASHREPRRLCQIRIGAITGDGIREWSPLQVL